MLDEEGGGLLLRKEGTRITHVSLTLAMFVGLGASLIEAGWFAQAYSGRLTAVEKELSAANDQIKALSTLQQLQQTRNAESNASVAVQLEGLNTKMSFVIDQLKNSAHRP